MHGLISVGLRVCVCAPVGVVLLIDRGVLPSALEEEMVR